MFARGCMAVPVYGGAGGISQVPSIRDVKIVTRANVVFLSKIVGETQVDFVSETVKIAMFYTEAFSNFSANFDDECFVKLFGIFFDF